MSFTAYPGNPVGMLKPVPTLVPVDFALSDDGLTIRCNDGDGSGDHDLPLIQFGHSAQDLLDAWGDTLTFEPANDLPGLPHGRYTVIKHVGEALAAFYLGNG